MKNTCIYKYHNKIYSTLEKQENETVTENGEWKLVKNNQLHKKVSSGILVFFKDGGFSVREGYGKDSSGKFKINNMVSGDNTQGKWYCDGDDEYFVEYDNGNFSSTKMGQIFDITNPKDKIAIDIIKQKLNLNDISDKSKPELNDLSTKLDKYKEKIESATWWGTLKFTWETVKNKVKETLDKFNNNTPSSTGSQSAGTSGGSTQKKLGTIIKPDNPEVSGIAFTYVYPGDKNWIYGVKDGNWYAKNRKTNNVFNISIVQEFKGSVDNLNKRFPNALNTTNNVGTEGPNNQTGPQGATNNSTTTPSNDQSNDTLTAPVRQFKQYETEPTLDSLN
jgi:hypothetical protein